MSNGYVLPTDAKDQQEALDFIDECPIFVVRKGKTLCHSTILRNILSYDESRDHFVYTDPGWWLKYYVGQEKYGGGWFTYETNYGGPKFGFLLHYMLQEDIPVLFIPNMKAQINNPSYFPDSQKANILRYNNYTGSHVMIGVKNWKEKGLSLIHI